MRSCTASRSATYSRRRGRSGPPFFSRYCCSIVGWAERMSRSWPRWERSSVRMGEAIACKDTPPPALAVRRPVLFAYSVGM
eukprot:2266842-Pleurochrysis_carterae.AAC.1